MSRNPSVPHVPEPNKKRGVCYAVTDAGVELPIVDVTCPEFALELSDAELGECVSQFIQEERRNARVPNFLRRILYRFFLRRAALARGVIGAHDAGIFLDGMSTYLLKLGPDNLGSAFTTAIDRRIAAALPALGVRLRLQDMARLLADGLAPRLAERPGAALQLLNIGGGSALDSLNALLVLQKRQPALLLGRNIVVRVLDLDDAGPNFGARALAALQDAGAPLANLTITFQHLHYNWSDATRLASLLDFPSGAVVATSSEGALFEYASDQEIIANLRALASQTPPDAFVTGSVTRADGASPYLNSFLRLPTRPRSLESFSRLAQEAGFKIRSSVDRPFAHNVSLERMQ